MTRDISIDTPDKRIYDEVKAKWDLIAKPIDGLGLMEDIVCRIAAISEDAELKSIYRSLLTILCADNGVVAEGVTQTGQQVTASVMEQMGRGASSVCRMAKVSGTDIQVYDIGVNTDAVYEGVDLRYKVGKGTRDLVREPAMSEAELERCIEAGIDIAARAKDAGYGLLAIGEMGIGNTTTSACVCAGLLGLDARTVTGRGAGLSDDGLKKKISVVQDAIDRYKLYDLPVTEVLRTVGGYDIAGLTGICIGAAISHIPVILDGFITETAALTAERLCPGVRDYLIASHSGREAGTVAIERELALEPVIHARLSLGEGTGAVMLIELIRQAMAVYSEVYGFDDIGMDGYIRY